VSRDRSLAAYIYRRQADRAVSLSHLRQNSTKEDVRICSRVEISQTPIASCVVRDLQIYETEIAFDRAVREREIAGDLRSRVIA